ncbi:unnamed protein product [Sphagnum jensenii]|uniref:MCAfunc domain-containing protein n=1 Tax=Sphagnum jensenii TaxID=128206 RepID=A0ABP1AUA5_9BRYO
MAGFFNWASWLAVGDVANVGQLAGGNAIQLIAMVIKAANHARMHKRNCRHFAQHLKLISALLEQLHNLTDLKKRPECREPLELLEQTLRKSLALVESCRDKSYLYLVAMGWVYVTKFRDYQDEIDKYLKLIPLISLVEKNRERLKAIEEDHQLYTMEEDEVKVHETLLNKKPVCELSKEGDSMRRVSRQLSRRYPGYSIEQILREENTKLQQELQHMRARMELEQCDVIEHLIDFTETAAADPEILEVATLTHEADGTVKRMRTKKNVMNSEIKHQHNNKKKNPGLTGPSSSPVGSLTAHYNHETKDWDQSLLACCAQPCLCMEVFCFPCDIFTRIASSISDGKISQGHACNNLAFHALYGGCCCYTCCIRRKLRKRYNIEGNACGDYWAHVCCCCCAITQEWHELQIQEQMGTSRKMNPPFEQAMEDY